MKARRGGVNCKTCLVLYKNHSKFYKVRGMDAYIMNMIFGYKVLNGDVCGFPDTTLNKVINTLTDSKISYQIIDVDKEPIIKEFGKINSYSKYLQKALESIDKKKKIDILIEKIENCDNEKLEKIIKVIENEFK